MASSNMPSLEGLEGDLNLEAFGMIGGLASSKIVSGLGFDDLESM
jgi:hypothetical protein